MKLKRTISVLTVLALMLALAACGGGKPAVVTPSVYDPNGTALPKSTEVRAEGGSLLLAEDAFGEEAEVLLQRTEDLSALTAPEKYELLGGGYEVSCSAYDGTILASDVILTADISGQGDAGAEQLFFVYYDEAGGEAIYMEPSSVDLKAGTMSIALPHFSLWAPAKLTEAEEIELFLDRYSAKLAVAKAGDEKASAALEPYLRAKLKALDLTKDAENELVHSIVGEIAGGLFDDAGELAAAAWKSIDTQDDGESFDDKCNEIIADKCTELMENLGAEKAASIFGTANSAAKFAGYLSEGDFKDAGKELGSMLADELPFGQVAMSAVGYVGAKVNESFTNWKSNEVEELYRMYKNGAEDIWGNEVIAGDWDSLLTYLNTSSGFTKAKAINRFYKMDKIAETCELYGWEYDDYEELPDKYREIFDRRAEEGLKNYFETRLRQETEAAKIKESERKCIETMLGITGALRSGNYTEYFKDKDNYSLSARLERLMQVRAQISQYVDEAALEESRKADAFNYGDVLNWWVSSADEHMGDRDAAVEAFCEKLRECELLNEFSVGPTLEELVGEYGGTVSLDALTVSDVGYEQFVSQESDPELGLSDMSQAECDEALEGMLEEGSISIGQTVTVIADDPASGACSVTFVLVSDDSVEITLRGSYSGGEITLDSGDGVLSRIAVTRENGKLRLSGKDVILGVTDEEDGSIVLLHAHATLSVEK